MPYPSTRLCEKRCTDRRTDFLFPRHDGGLSGQADSRSGMNLAHAAAWEPCDLHDLGFDSCVGSVLYR